jgi:hypothetical protein
MFKSDLRARGNLDTTVIRRTPPHSARSLRIPGVGRVILTGDPGEGQILARETFATNLSAIHYRKDGTVKDHYDLGSGLVTNVGVTALANDFAWAANCQTLKLANYHATGTGTTSAAATQLALSTPAAPTATTAVAGTQSLVSAANSQIYQTLGTINYTSTVAVTEWGLFTAATLSATTGSPATATTATGLTATGTPYTASTSSVQGEQQLIVSTGTTAVYGLITSNTTSGLVIPAWYKTADGTAGSTPGSTETFTLTPVMFDRKTFSALNVVSGDSISFKYQLTIASGS